MDVKITAIVLAAGQGRRMNTKIAKQFLTLKDKPVIYYSLKAFEDSNVDEIILVTGEEQLEYCREEVVKRYQFKKVTKVIEGGNERYDSVFKALMEVGTTDYVLIHDGARPFISQKLIQEVINRVVVDKACILGTPVKETIKVADASGFITATPNRNTLWSAQTPQAFIFSSIKDAYEKFYQEKEKEKLGITDDAMVYEAYQKKPVKIILGDYHNIKLTTPEDLMLAERIINQILCEYNI